MGGRSVMKFAAAALALFAAGCAVTACTSQSEVRGADVTPQEVTENGDRIYEAVRAVFGEEGWDLDRQWFACDTSDGQNGVSLRLDSRFAQELPAQPQQLAERVQVAWRELGVDAQIVVNEDLDPVRYILSDPPFLGGVHEDGSITDLWVGSGIANFGYVSPCVPGDIFELQPSRTFSPAPTVTPPSSP